VSKRDHIAFVFAGAGRHGREHAFTRCAVLETVLLDPAAFKVMLEEDIARRVARHRDWGDNVILELLEGGRVSVAMPQAGDSVIDARKLLKEPWAVSRFRQPPAEQRVFRLQINPPEGGRFIFGVRNSGITLSPDGSTAAFVASGEGKTGLWVRPLGGTGARLLVRGDDIMSPFWSPDNKSIGFFAGAKLQRVDLAGGTPLPICDAAGYPRGGAWSSDGRIIFATLASNGVFQVPASAPADPRA
jgi:hypothetical protein